MEAGTVLADRYRLAERLGRGAMGEVWRAQDSRLYDRDVAVKMLLVRDPDPGELERFTREAGVAARLAHPGITVVHDIGQHDDQVFIVMELLRGENLGTLLARYPQGLPASQVVSFAVQVASALATAHAAGVIHRDLKPANLFVQGDHVKICDFGLARDDAFRTITMAGEVIGTPAYMAPEQWNGEPATTSSDLYALGGIIWQMLTGEMPFPGPSIAALLNQHLNMTPVPVASRVPYLPPALSDLVQSMLAKDPAQRPPSTTWVLEALTRLRDSARQWPQPGPGPAQHPVLPQGPPAQHPVMAQGPPAQQPMPAQGPPAGGALAPAAEGNMVAATIAATTMVQATTAAPGGPAAHPAQATTAAPGLPAAYPAPATTAAPGGAAAYPAPAAPAQAYLAQPAPAQAYLAPPAPAQAHLGQAAPAQAHLAQAAPAQARPAQAAAAHGGPAGPVAAIACAPLGPELRVFALTSQGRIRHCSLHAPPGSAGDGTARHSTARHSGSWDGARDGASWDGPSWDTVPAGGGTGWTSWSDVLSPTGHQPVAAIAATSAPATISLVADHNSALAAVADDGLYISRSGGAWRSMDGLSGQLIPAHIVDIAVASWTRAVQNSQPGQPRALPTPVNVFALDASGQLWKNSRAGWLNVPVSRPVSAIAACSFRNEDQLLLCVADGAVNVAYYETQGGVTSSLPAWQYAPAVPVVDIACLSLAADHQEAFALDANGGIWHNRSLPPARSAAGQQLPTSWTAWNRIETAPGPVTVIAAGSHGDSRSPDGGHERGTLLAATADGTIHQASCDLDITRQSVWANWTQLPPL